MLSQTLIKAAASRLPSSIRERYLEEWLRDLQDQPGALLKLKWAFGCAMGVFSMRREAMKEGLRHMVFEFELSTGESVAINVPSVALLVSIIGLAKHVEKLPTRGVFRPMRSALLKTSVRLIVRAQRVRSTNGNLELKKVVKVMRDSGHWQAVTHKVDGVPVSRLGHADEEWVDLRG